MNIYESLAPSALDAVTNEMGVEYTNKMMHKIPDAKVMDREKYILEKCKGKRVLNLGCASGTLHGKIKTVSSSLFGVDKHEPCDMRCDLDLTPMDLHPVGDYDEETPGFDAQIIIAGEIVEHLGNPGRMIQTLRRFECPLLITVPNALTSIGQKWLKHGYENVNSDHVAWYSYHTMKNLVTRYGFTIQEFYWYGGKPLTAEGMIFLVT